MYELDELGKIVIVRNLVFPDSNGKMQVDHAYKKGRLCIHIGEKFENYFVPMTSQKIPNSLQKYYFPIKQEHLEYGVLRSNRISFANTRVIVKNPVYGLYEIAQLTIESYYQFISQILHSEVHLTPDIFVEIKGDLEEQKEEIEKRYTYHIPR